MASFEAAEMPNDADVSLSSSCSTLSDEALSSPPVSAASYLHERLSTVSSAVTELEESIMNSRKNSAGDFSPDEVGGLRFGEEVDIMNFMPSSAEEEEEATIIGSTRRDRNVAAATASRDEGATPTVTRDEETCVGSSDGGYDGVRNNSAGGDVGAEWKKAKGGGGRRRLQMDKEEKGYAFQSETQDAAQAQEQVRAPADGSFAATPDNGRSSGSPPIPRGSAASTLNSSTSTDKHTPYNRRSTLPSQADSALGSPLRMQSNRLLNGISDGGTAVAAAAAAARGRGSSSSLSDRAAHLTVEKARHAKKINNELKASLERVTEELGEASRVEVKQRHEISNLREELERSKSEYEAAKASVGLEVEELKVEVNRLWRKMERETKAQFKSLKKKDGKIESMEAKMSTMKEALRAAEDQQQQVHSKEQELRQQKQLFQNTEAQLSQSVEEVRKWRHWQTGSYWFSFFFFLFSFLQEPSQKNKHKKHKKKTTKSNAARQVRRLQGSLSSVKGALQNARQELSEANSMVSNLKSQVQQHQGTIGDLSGRISEMQVQKMDVITTLNSLRHEHSDTTNTLRVTVTKCEDLRSEKHRLRSELSSAKSKAAEHAAKVEMVCERERARLGELTGLKDREASMKNDIALLKHEAGEKMKFIEQAQRRLEVAYQERAEAVQACSELDDAVKTVEEELEQERIDKDRVMVLKNEESKRFAKAMAYFKDSLLEISESQRSHKVLCERFGVESNELREQIGMLQREKARMREQVEDLSLVSLAKRIWCCDSSLPFVYFPDWTVYNSISDALAAACGNMILFNFIFHPILRTQANCRGIQCLLSWRVKSMAALDGAMPITEPQGRAQAWT